MVTKAKRTTAAPARSWLVPRLWKASGTSEVQWTVAITSPHDHGDRETEHSRQWGPGESEQHRRRNSDWLSLLRLQPFYTSKPFISHDVRDSWFYATSWTCQANSEVSASPRDRAQRWCKHLSARRRLSAKDHSRYERGESLESCASNRRSRFSWGLVWATWAGRALPPATVWGGANDGTTWTVLKQGKADQRSMQLSELVPFCKTDKRSVEQQRQKHLGLNAYGNVHGTKSLKR